MTLVLTHMSDDLIVQVADRRLTVSGTGQLVDDDANKAIQYGPSFAVAYTGLARIGRQKTDEWAMEALRHAPDIGHAVNELRDRAAGSTQLPP